MFQTVTQTIRDHFAVGGWCKGVSHLYNNNAIQNLSTREHPRSREGLLYFQCLNSRSKLYVNIRIAPQFCLSHDRYYRKKNGLVNFFGKFVVHTGVRVNMCLYSLLDSTFRRLHITSDKNKIAAFDSGPRVGLFLTYNKHASKGI
jgi:hypothetical protein